MEDGSRESEASRRRFLRRSSAVALSTLVAGCAGSGFGDESTRETKTGATTTRQKMETTTNTTAGETTPDREALRTEFDSRERFGSPGTRLPGTDFDRDGLSSWEVVKGAATLDSQTAFAGSKSVKLTDDGGDILLQRTFDSPRDFSGRDLSLALRSTTPRQFAFAVHVEDADGNDAIHELRDLTYQPPDVDWFRSSPGVYTTKGDPDLSAVERVRLHVLNPRNKSLDIWVDDLRVTPKPEKGYLVLSWDDGRMSYYDKAAPIHDELDFPAVLTHPSRPSMAGQGPFMPVEKLTERDEAGDEIVAHGSIDRYFHEISASELESILARNKRWLREHGFEDRFVVYPGNNYDATTLDVASDYFFMGGMNQSGDVNPTGLGFDPLALPRTVGHDLDISKRLVDTVAAHRNVGILNFHAFKSKNTIRASEYETLLRYIDEKQNLEVITFSDLWEMRQTV